MDGFEWVVVFGTLALFGLIIALILRAGLKAKAASSQIRQSLGFRPIQPTPDLVQKIAQLYQNLRLNRKSLEAGNYHLLNVFSKQMPDCDVVLFDLIHTAGDEDGYSEKQAVAVISPHLNLPPFVVFPKVNTEGALSDLANKVIGWVVAKFGSPVGFPEVPEFDERYLVSSPDPEGTRQFLDESKLRRLAKTTLVGVNACGELFTLSPIDRASRPLQREATAERVNQAMDVFSIFLS